MNQSSSFRTLLFVSLLSCRTSVSSSTRRNRNTLVEHVAGATDQTDVVEKILRVASIALVASFALATTPLPSSQSLALDLDLNNFKSNEIFPDSCNSCSEPSEIGNSSIEPTQQNEKTKYDVIGALNVTGEVDRGDVITGEVGRGDVLECVQEYCGVDDNDVKKMWMRRARLWAFKPRNSLQVGLRTMGLYHVPLSHTPLTQQEYPSMHNVARLVKLFTEMESDSLGFSSRDYSISSRSGTDFLGLTPAKKTRNMLQQEYPSIHNVARLVKLFTEMESDSLGFSSSDYSISSRSSTDFLGLTSAKKTRNMLPQPNVEWATIE